MSDEENGAGSDGDGGNADNSSDNQNTDTGGGESGGGGQSSSSEASFLDQVKVPENLGTLQTKGYKTADEVVTAYRNIVKLHGRDPSIVEVPGEDATDDDRNVFFNRLGRPSDAAGYDFKFEEGAEPNEATVEWFRGEAHKLGLSQSQANALVGSFGGHMTGVATAATEAAEVKTAEALTSLEKEWGVDYNTNVASGQRLVRAAGLDEDTLSQIENSMGTPAMMKMMATMGKRIGEDDFVEGARENDFAEGGTKEQALAEIEALKGDTEFRKSLFDVTHANHEFNSIKWKKLQERAYGAEQG